MISPETFISLYKNKSYHELLKIRESLLNDIYTFESIKPGDVVDDVELIEPSEDVVYQSNLEYLAELCKLIAKKYRQEVDKESLFWDTRNYYDCHDA